MSDLYSGKYAPPPVKVVGYWAHRKTSEVKRGLLTTYADLGVTGKVAAQAIARSFQLARDMEGQEIQFRRAFK